MTPFRPNVSISLEVGDRSYEVAGIMEGECRLAEPFEHPSPSDGVLEVDSDGIVSRKRVRVYGYGLDVFLKAIE